MNFRHLYRLQHQTKCIEVFYLLPAELLFTQPSNPENTWNSSPLQGYVLLVVNLKGNTLYVCRCGCVQLGSNEVSAPPAVMEADCAPFSVLKGAKTHLFKA